MTRRDPLGRTSRLLAGALVAALSLGACSATPSTIAADAGAPPSGAPGSAAPATVAGSPSTSASTSRPTSTSTEPSGASTLPGGATAASTMRSKRYCEVLLVQVVDGQASADVYNSYPLNECPDALWTKLDAKAIAGEESVTLAVLNGPRFWLMDSVAKAGGSASLPQKTFGGIEMYRQASVDIGSLADAAKPYTPHAVDRDTVFTFDAGRSVYELVAPDGTTFVMQTWSQQKDPTLVEADLAALGPRLQLPAGWTYRTRMLDEPLRIVTTNKVAKVLQDDLGNSYSQVTEG